MKHIILLLLLSFTIISCDDSSGSSSPPTDLEISTIEADPVLYSSEKKVLTSLVTVTINDSDGNPIEGKFVTIDSTDSEVSFNVSEIETDENGQALFMALSHRLETATITAYTSNNSEIDPLTADSLTKDATISFTMSLSSVVDQDSYTFENGSFTGILTVEDSDGAVKDVDVTVKPPEGFSMNISEITTDGSGEGLFPVETNLSGVVDFAFSVKGIDDDFILPLHFHGPDFTVNITNAMSSPSFQNPQLGIMALSIVDGEGLTIEGMIGQGVDLPTFALGDVQLNDIETLQHFLPIIPPAEHLYANGDVGGDLGIFMLFTYNDVDGNNLWETGEPITGMKISDGVILFVDPSAPENAQLKGWMLIDNLGEEPNFEEFIDDMPTLDFEILSAPVNTPTIHGSIASNNLTNKRVNWFLVDGPAFYTAAQAGNPFSILSNPNQYEVLFNAMVEADGSYEGAVTDPNDLIDSATMESWKIILPLGEGASISQLVILPIYYEDIDQNGDFNQDDTILGLSRPPVGGEWNISYIIDFPEELALFLADRLFIHYGFNWWAGPTEKSITSIVPNGSDFDIVLDDNLPNGWVDVDFTIYESGASDDATPIANGTLSTDGSNSITTSSCMGCAGVTTGMDLKITESYESTTFIDWAESFNMAPFMN
jgi:Bacterial Ig-like domain (group 1)